MATPVQRAVSLANALVNSNASADQIRRAGRGMAYRYGRLAEFDAGDNVLQAQILLDGVFKSVLAAIIDVEQKDAVQNASDSARNQANADFQPAP